MKKILLTLTTITTFGLCACSAEKNVEWLIEHTMQQNLIDQMGQQVGHLISELAQQEGTLSDSDRQEVELLTSSCFKAGVTAAKTSLHQIIPIFLKHFTEQELEQMVLFHKTELGQKFAQVQIPLNHEIAPLVESECKKAISMLESENASELLKSATTAKTPTETNILWMIESELLPAIKAISEVEASEFPYCEDLKQEMLQQKESLAKNICLGLRNNLPMITALYLHHFTEEEIDRLVKFKQSTVGQKALASLAPLMCEINITMKPQREALERETNLRFMALISKINSHNEQQKTPTA
jgi:hypothetical protein